MNSRRIGTFTLGMILIAFGVLFLIQYAIPITTVSFAIKFWPLVFIFLGAEVLYGYFKHKGDQCKYDIGAFVLLFLIIIFAMCIGGMEWLIENAPSHYWFQI